MARLHEHQGKALLAEQGIAVPRGDVARSPQEAAAAAERIGGRVVLKVQAWITGRAARGGVQFARTPAEAAGHAERLLSMSFGNFPVREVLVEEALDLRQEFFVSLSIDDAAMAPVLLLAREGGSGVEERARSVTRLPVDVTRGLDRTAVAQALRPWPLPDALRDALAGALERVVALARRWDARSVEINPLAITDDGRLVAADCRITIDDYAVFRHPELGIEIARELDHPATDLERVAYAVEQADHRGTFYFAQLPTDGAQGRLIGFHGAGGGGSMMSMDAITAEGFVPANYCDTSGNPSAAKVYRAARIILAQPGLCGYFGSGSGVASQEQFHSAYGLAKAFIEMGLSIPAVLRLGGNSEDRARDILHDACRGLWAPVECYRKDDTPASCARRFRELVERCRGRPNPPPMVRRVPDFARRADAQRIPIKGGCLVIDRSACDEAAARLIVQHSAGLFRLDDRGRPALAIPEAEAADKDSEFLALEIECRRAGRPVAFLDLPVPGLDAA
jgi:succinyl-CoA synthetase beta subunit